jgi:hypothetical protein
MLEDKKNNKQNIKKLIEDLQLDSLSDNLLTDSSNDTEFEISAELSHLEKVFETAKMYQMEPPPEKYFHTVLPRIRQRIEQRNFSIRRIRGSVLKIAMEFSIAIAVIFIFFQVGINQSSKTKTVVGLKNYIMSLPTEERPTLLIQGSSVELFGEKLSVENTDIAQIYEEYNRGLRYSITLGIDVVSGENGNGLANQLLYEDLSFNETEEVIQKMKRRSLL